MSFKPSLDLVGDRKALNWLIGASNDLTTEPGSFDAAGCVSVAHHPPRLPLTWEQALSFGPGPRQEQTLRNHANLEEAAC